MSQEEEVLGKAYDSRLMRRLLTYLRPYWWQTAVALAAILLKVVLGPDVIGPYLAATVIDKYLVLAHGARHELLDHWLSPNAMTGVGQVALLYLASLLFNFVLEFVQTYLMQWTGQKVMYDLRSQIFRHLQEMHVGFFDKNPVGRLVTRVTSDVDALNEMFTAGVVSIFEDVFILGGIIVVMLGMQWRLALITFAVLPLIFWVTMIFRKSVRESYRRIRVAIARINSYLQEHVTGMVVLQLFNREKRAYQRFDRINAQHMEAFKDAILAYAIYYPVVEILSTIAIASVVWFGGLWALQEAGLDAQKQVITVGIVTAFVTYAQRFFRPIQDLSEKYNILQSAMASSERVFKLLDTPVEIISPAGPRKTEGKGLIEFDHVWFAYRKLDAAEPEEAQAVAAGNGHSSPDGSGYDWILRDVSFSIEPGESVAIVGHTGAGKTTIISLLMRFYDIQKGAIRIDGVDIREMDLKDLRRRFGVVLQDPFLFSGTIENNIRLGSDWITDEQIEAAAENVNVAEFIRTLPQEFKEPVLERGSTLSTGQKQLISFARALAHDPKILVLDEATSSVDTETELRVRDALTRMVEGRTSVIIAHRLSTIQRADKIIVMHKGKVREIGSHQELLAQRGIYWKLYQLQYKDQEVGVGETQVGADD
ncbi:MAG TPA: ABC transporter ATP-binding protein [Candidatus Limnocylindrales bacterium]|nr:ABC transporter ATP-binding protein [Candidatus Limnocylindrales bacterium]